MKGRRTGCAHLRWTNFSNHKPEDNWVSLKKAVPQRRQLIAGFSRRRPV